MSSYVDVLNQHAEISKAWAVCTKGIKRLKAKDVKEISIATLCVEILKYKANELPELRFSFRLTLKLFDGAVKIFERQVSMVNREVCAFLSTVNKPKMLDSSSSELTPPLKKITKKKTKQPASIADPEQFMEDLVREYLEQPAKHAEEAAFPQPQPDLHRLPEEPAPLPEMFGDFGELGGDLTPEEIQELEQHPENVTEVQQGPRLFEVEGTAKRRLEEGADEVHREKKRKTKTSPSSSERPTEEPAVEQQQPPTTSIISRETSPSLRLPARLRQRAGPMRSRKLFLSRPKKTLTIFLRCKSLIDDRPFPQVELDLKVISPKRGLVKMWIDEILAEKAVKNRREQPRAGISRRTPSIETSHRKTVHSESSSDAPPPKKIRVEALVHAPSDHQDVPRSSIIPEEIVVPPVMETEVEPLPEIPSLQPLGTVESLPGSCPRTSNEESDDKKKREEDIINFMRNWDETDEVTIEDVSPKPTNKFNIAITFGNLLNLVKKRYVVLKHEADSLELKSIEKGEKLRQVP